MERTSNKCHSADYRPTSTFRCCIWWVLKYLIWINIFCWRHFFTLTNSSQFYAQIIVGRMRSLPTGLTTEFDLLSTTEDLQKLIHRKNGTVYAEFVLWLWNKRMNIVSIITIAWSCVSTMQTPGRKWRKSWTVSKKLKEMEEDHGPPSRRHLSVLCFRASECINIVLQLVLSLKLLLTKLLTPQSCHHYLKGTDACSRYF
jgi:hypothetical protein